MKKYITITADRSSLQLIGLAIISSSLFIVAIAYAMISSLKYNTEPNIGQYVSNTDVMEPVHIEENTVDCQNIELLSSDLITKSTEIDIKNNDISHDWGSYDNYLLMKIAMAEAGGEDVEGKALVMMVVLNRVYSDSFPNTIEDVIYQSRNGIYQFSPVGNGRFDSVEPDDECKEALNMIMIDKWDGSHGALYFESHKDADNWHSRNLEYLFTHGGHRFYK